jgi:protoporphyrinogen oxidase
MQKILIVGAGISGVSIAKMLTGRSEVTVYEKRNIPGGLIHCTTIDGYLYHKVGGHLFNSKIEKVLDWFWQHFDKENEFIKAKRNARILWDDKIIGYPVEGSIYQMDEKTIHSIVNDWLQLKNNKLYSDPFAYPNFEAFLKDQFGNTLYQKYFKPYNEKIWQTDLSNIPMNWLEGKLPMPNLPEMIFNNILHREESEMVHSTFYYPRNNGSQFIVNRISEGLNIICNVEINSIKYEKGQWIVNDNESFDAIIYTGDVRNLSTILKPNINKLNTVLTEVKQLHSNGTSNMLCTTDETDTSWLYIPEPSLMAHRIIYTGNFSENNNKPGERKSCVVEFSGMASVENMKNEIKKLPGNLNPIANNYEPNSYIVQNKNTRELISELKKNLIHQKFFLLGRFAEWEYYNMDKCIEASMNLSTTL